jgi:hypothetical protein
VDSLLIHGGYFAPLWISCGYSVRILALLLFSGIMAGIPPPRAKAAEGDEHACLESLGIRMDKNVIPWKQSDRTHDAYPQFVHISSTNSPKGFPQSVHSLWSLCRLPHGRIILK